MSIAGIYAVKCLKNQKIYVGQSINIPLRLQNHLTLLYSNKHSCIPLQKDYNEYGITNFSFKIMLVLKENEYSDKEKLQKELLMYEAIIGQKFEADKIKTGYNYESKFAYETREYENIYICPEVNSIFNKVFNKNKESYIDLYKIILTTYDETIDRVCIRPNVIGKSIGINGEKVKRMVNNLIKYEILNPEIYSNTISEDYPNGYRTSYYAIRKVQKKFL